MENAKSKDIKKTNVENFLKYRKITYKQEHEIFHAIGVPQSSILGPSFWNVMYDEVLTLKLHEACTTIAYAGDLALIAKTNNTQDLDAKPDDAQDNK